MNVPLAPEYETIINNQIASGGYTSATDVICAGLRLLNEQEALRRRELDALRHEVNIGIEELQRGEGAPWNVEEIKAEGRRRLAERGR